MVVGAVVYIALMSFFVSAVCGYMAGLIGSSNSPLSGIGILVVIGAALLLVPGIRSGLPAGGGTALVAYALFVTAVVFAVAAIANNNLQDLKTGQLVDATPWKQQVALVIGVIAGAAIIPPILDLLNHAYGFAGAPGPHHEHPLAGAAGRPDLGAGAGRDPAQRRLEPDPDRRAGRRAGDRRRRNPAPLYHARRTSRRSPWASGSTCRRKAR